MTTSDQRYPSVQLRVRARPGASRTEIAGYHNGALAVRVAAPPEKGRANRALLAFLAEALDLRPRDLEIVAGAAGRDKLVRVRGLDEAELARRLKALPRTRVSCPGEPGGGER